MAVVARLNHWVVPTRRGRRLPGALLAMAGVVAAVLVAPVGRAQPPVPPGFPDLAAFTEVPVDPYFMWPPRRNARTVNFSTPFDINCGFSASEDEPGYGIDCRGMLPGLQDVKGSRPGPDGCLLGSIAEMNGRYHVGTQGFGCDRGHDFGTLLDVGQKLSYGGVTCVVGDGPLVACLDIHSGSSHGFVAQPSGSWAF